MAMHLHDDDAITAIADAIRLKTDSVAEMRVEDMPLAISMIEGGGGGIEYTDITMPACNHSSDTWTAIWPQSERKPNQICFAWKLTGDKSSNRMLLFGYFWTAASVNVKTASFIYINDSGIIAQRYGFDPAYTGNCEAGAVFRRVVVDR